VSLADVEPLVGANDLAGCREAAQKLRRAGAKMPEPLLALAALDPKHYGTAQPK
jgi:hypothetical protein